MDIEILKNQPPFRTWALFELALLCHFDMLQERARRIVSVDTKVYDKSVMETLGLIRLRGGRGVAKIRRGSSKILDAEANVDPGARQERPCACTCYVSMQMCVRQCVYMHTYVYLGVCVHARHVRACGLAALATRSWRGIVPLAFGH